MLSFKKFLLGGSATAAIAVMSFAGALAQGTALEIEEVSSSASRIDLKGFEAPTPVSVIGIETINRDAKVNIGDQIRELPQIRGGSGINSGSNSRNVSQSNAAVDTVSIRGLGSQRNLVLIDRQRVVASSAQSSEVDIAMIPSGVVQRVDVVTGGASAAWGSDAVTGVVNLVLNKTFEGFKGSVSYANKTEVEHNQYRADATWGTSFFGGKGHVVLSANWTISNDTVFTGQLDQDNRSFVYNPAYCAVVTGSTCSSVNAGQPLLKYAYDVGSATSTGGGLINGNTVGVAGSGLAATSATSPNGGLRGLHLVGAEKVLTNFNYGTVHNNSTCYNGCDNNRLSGLTPWDPIPAAPYHSATYFAYTSYQILPDVKASIQLNYGRLGTRTFGGERLASAVTIYADNPYLPQELAQRFVCSGAASATCQTTLSNGFNPYTKQNDLSLGGGTGAALTLAQRQSRPAQTMTFGLDYLNNAVSTGANSAASNSEWTLDNLCNAIGVPCSYANKVLSRGAFSLEGSLGDSFTWNAYIQHGENTVRAVAPQNAVSARFNNAQDAVRVTSGNVGASNLPIGSIQCRGLLNPSLAAKTANLPVGQDDITGCSPMDPFGYNNVSNAARNFIEPGLNPDSTGILSTVYSKNAQTAAALSLQGVLPWQLPAGEIGVAFGGEWRMEQGAQFSDDLRANNSGWGVGNVTPFKAKYHVEEGFIELDLPILKDTVVQSLGLNLGGRLTSYSTSGLVETWKVGIASQIMDDLKFRGTWSYDIRAPNLWDLYSPGGRGGVTCAPLDPASTAGNNPCFNVTGGNANLQPEKANTASAGFVFTPTFIEGLTASIDWYQIHLHGGITNPSNALIRQRCLAGDPVFCNQITFRIPGDKNSPIEEIRSTRVNAAVNTTAGFDAALAYGFDLFTGSVDINVNANYVYDYAQDLNGVYFQGAGLTSGFYSGGAKFQGNVNLNYREGAWTFGVQTRITGGARLDNGIQGQTQVGGLVRQTVSYQVINGVSVPTVSSGQRDDAILGFRNYVDPRAPVDIRVQYRWTNNITLFGAIDNIQNLPTDTTLRRAYRMGVRFNY